MKNITTQGCLNKVIKDYIVKYGKMKALLVDNTSAFSSPTWKKALEHEGIKCYHSSMYHGASNASERILKDVGILMRISCNNKQKSWYQYCGLIENILYRTPNPTTKDSPERLITGKDPPSLFHGLPDPIGVPGQD